MKPLQELLDKAPGAFLKQYLPKEKAIGDLCALIEDTETLLCVTRATLDSIYLVAVTDRRLILAGRSMGKKSTLLFALNGISGIVQETGILFCKLDIRILDRNLILKGIPKESIDALNKALCSRF